MWGKGVAILVKKLFGVISFFLPYIPKGITGIFIVSNFFIDWSSQGVGFAAKEAGLTVLSAERTIQEAVTLAVENSPEYGLTDVFSIVVSFYILYRLAQFFRYIFVGFLGAQAKDDNAKVDASLIGGFVLVAIIEYCFYVAMTGSFTGFIPIKDGIIYLLMNIQSVISNINWLVF